MPLHDHFHAPLSERRPWESFHTTWASSLADALNEDVLPPGYIALEQIHAGAALEIDVATFANSGASSATPDGGTATAARIWTPSAAPVVLPATFPPSCTIEVISTEGGRTLVAAIELISPANKDRPASRRLFAGKCAAYLSRGMGLIIIDVVTSRQGNLHHELIDLMGLDPGFRPPSPGALYGVAYRPLTEAGVGRIETWPLTLSVGQPLPTMPLSLGAELCVALDFEQSYLDACRRRRVDEALGS
ncbi:hypothetical protein AYO40_02680 [Planctomycetaceae bacterium SCGC AG-212-D15]|nr:hypothetical protein AYO40_02680 [Planctomycetaceae bacterium SCGC AG-212-D15]